MRTLAYRWLMILLLCGASSMIYAASPPAPHSPVLRIAYFIPADRTAAPDAVERLDRIMADVQSFYRQGMQANGYGPKTFTLDRDARGALRIYTVHGREPMRAYGRNAAGVVHREMKEALARQGIDMDAETFVVFQMALEWRDGKAIEIGPFVGGGGPVSGTAWVYDDAHLDPRLLPSKEPGGYYGRPCSLGEFNTQYIGGIAHELGHAFGLPHDCEQAVQRPILGRSLMGAGNHTYRQELRNEGRGAFLSAASAMLLSHHPLFTGIERPAQTKAACRLTGLDAAFEDGHLVLRGRVKADPAAFGVIAYNDAEAIKSDYDAVGWTDSVSGDGAFQLKIGELKPGKFELRLRICQVSGNCLPPRRAIFDKAG